MMWLFLLACACTGQADADGAPPFPDGLPSDAEPADDLGTVAELIEEPEAPSIVAVDRAAVEDHAAPSPLELLDADAGLEDVAYVEAPEIVDADGVRVAPVADPTTTQRYLPPHPWLRLADEIAGALAALAAAIASLAAFMWKVWPLLLEIRDDQRNRRDEPTPQPMPTPSREDVESITKLALEHTRIRQEHAASQAENERLSAAVTGYEQELQRLRSASSRRLAAQSSVSDEIEDVQRRGSEWIVG